MNTNTETTGQTPTNKTCNTCGTELNKHNWYEGFQKNCTYKCKPCTREYQHGIYVKQQVDKIKKHTQQRFDRIKSGYVYVITNPAWPEWVKIGKGADAKDRFDSYQTYSPMRDYELMYCKYFDNRHKAEKTVQDIAETRAEKRHEWFNMSVEEAKEIINGL